LASLPLVLVNRGRCDEARRILDLCGDLATSSDPEDRTSHALARATVLRAEGNFPAALEAGQAAMRVRELGLGHEAVKAGYVEAVEAALALGDPAKVEELLVVVDGLRPVEVPQFVRAHAARFRARLAAEAGTTHEVQAGFKSAAGMFREIGAPFYRAVTLLEHGEWLIEQGRGDEAKSLFSEAGPVFERLKAVPWLERLAEAEPAASAHQTTGL